MVRARGEGFHTWDSGSAHTHGEHACPQCCSPNTSFCLLLVRNVEGLQSLASWVQSSNKFEATSKTNKCCF